jgi:hypothetical protein
MASLDLRNANRYQIAALVFFWWCGSDGFVHTRQGTTRDISSSGVLISAGICPTQGARIYLEVQLPPIKGRDRGMLLQGEGLVVRVEDVFNVDNEVYVSPLRAAFGGKTVFQAWTFSIRLVRLTG